MLNLRQTVLGFLICAGVLALENGAGAADLSEGNAVVVVFNQNNDDSKAVAEHYAAKRGVPNSQVVGLNLPSEETISREAFRTRLMRPLQARFLSEDWFEYEYEVISATREREGGIFQKVKKASVRYLALCFGVPLRISADPEFKEPGSDDIRIELRRNEAAVDSELALLPLDKNLRRIYGPLTNPAYGATNAVSIRPEMGVLMVSRLDGPTAEQAKALVDRAMEAEEDGVWGRAYFDLRGITSGEYKVGDDWLARAADFSRHVGFETYVDQESVTFPESFPMSHVGIYAGWYDGNVSGPFKASRVRFMPGAIAYHLHSFSAQTIRNPRSNWVGPLIAAGAAATMGCVYEPYLALTPNLELFFSRLFLGFGFAEAAYASQQALSWQTTVVGDPLYRPFSKPLNILQADLVAKKSPLITWLRLMNINRALVNGAAVEEAIRVLTPDAAVQMSPILMEKLGDLQAEQGDHAGAAASYQRALTLKPHEENQSVRLHLRLAGARQIAAQSKEAVAAYLALAREHDDYPGLSEALGDALKIAETVGDQELLGEVRERLGPLTESDSVK